MKKEKVCCIAVFPFSQQEIVQRRGAGRGAYSAGFFRVFLYTKNRFTY